MVRQFVQWFEKNRLIINVGETTAVSLAVSFHHIQNNNFECLSIKLDNKCVMYSESTKLLGL